MIRSRSTPHQIALGAAIGIFIAWTPTLGFQMAIAVPLCLLLRANPLAAIPPVWITNPLTAVAVYGFNYKIGRYFTGGPSFRQFQTQMKDVFLAMRTDGVWQGFVNMLRVGEEVVWPLILGSIIAGVILGLLLYGMTYWAVIWARMKFPRHRVAGEEAQEGAESSTV